MLRSLNSWYNLDIPSGKNLQQTGIYEASVAARKESRCHTPHTLPLLVRHRSTCTYNKEHTKVDTLAFGQFLS